VDSSLSHNPPVNSRRLKSVLLAVLEITWDVRAMKFVIWRPANAKATVLRLALIPILAKISTLSAKWDKQDVNLNLNVRMLVAASLGPLLVVLIVIMRTPSPSWISGAMSATLLSFPAALMASTLLNLSAVLVKTVTLTGPTLVFVGAATKVLFCPFCQATTPTLLLRFSVSTLTLANVSNVPLKPLTVSSVSPSSLLSTSLGLPRRETL